VMNCGVCGRKLSWRNVRYYCSICLYLLAKTTKKISHGEARTVTWTLHTGDAAVGNYWPLYLMLQNTN